jgi:hypothetical protein
MKISGNELLKLGVTGRKTGETLKKLLDSIMRGEVPNEREELLLLAVKLNEKT